MAPCLFLPGSGSGAVRIIPNAARSSMFYPIREECRLAKEVAIDWGSCQAENV